jgi:hypothetical protein
VTLGTVQNITGAKSFSGGLVSFNSTLKDIFTFEKGNSKIKIDTDNSNVLLQTSHKFQNPVNIAMLPTGFVSVNYTTPRSQLSVKGGLTLESLNGYDATNKIDFVQNWDEQWDQLRLHTALTPAGGGTFCISKLNSQQSNLTNMLSINSQQLSISSNNIVQSGTQAILCVNPAKPKNYLELASGDGFAYIDIHAGEVSSSDYDVRLIAYGKTLQIEGELLKVQMPLQVTGLSTMQAIVCASIASGQVSCTSLTANSINATSLSSSSLTSSSLALTSADPWMIDLNRTSTSNAFGCGLQFKTDSVLNARVYGGRSDFAWNYSYLAFEVQTNQVLNSGTYRGADMYLDHDGLHLKQKLEFLYEADPASQWKVYPLGNMRLGFYRGALQAFVDFNGNWIPLSDARKKIDVETLDPAKSLAEILQLRPVSYHLTTQPQGFAKKSIGFLAQEVEGINPHAVTTLDDDDETKLLCYQDLFTHGLNAIKLLYEDNKSLRLKMEQLTKRLDSLEEICLLSK